MLTPLAGLWAPFAARPVSTVATSDDPITLIGVLGATRLQLLVGATLGMAAAFS